ncbi:MAG: DUF3786 domain-containing protein [Candidatus Bathyarchaeota archaeon]|nr:DUF3786 domain-containing protein [Candidatus Bathyarchaeota archaeon]
MDNNAKKAEIESLRQDWVKKFKTLFLMLRDNEISINHLQKILGNKGKLNFSPSLVNLNLKIFGFNVDLTYNFQADSLDVNFEDFISKGEDLNHLLFTYTKILNQRILKPSLNQEEKFVSISMLHGGFTAKAYEKKIVNFIVDEVVDADKTLVLKIGKIMDGYFVQHLTADWAFELEVLNGFRIRLAYWKGENGIPSNTSILYGAEILKIDLPVEDIMVLTEIFVNRFVACYRKITGKKPRKMESLYS